jgi:hypothetical protein
VLGSANHPRPLLVTCRCFLFFKQNLFFLADLNNISLPKFLVLSRQAGKRSAHGDTRQPGSVSSLEDVKALNVDLGLRMELGTTFWSGYKPTSVVLEIPSWARVTRPCSARQQLTFVSRFRRAHSISTTWRWPTPRSPTFFSRRVSRRTTG